MSFEHAMYIPIVALVGLFFGYMVGLRAARAEDQQKRERLKK